MARLNSERDLHRLLFETAIGRANVPKDLVRLEMRYGAALGGYEAYQVLKRIAAGIATDKDAHALYSRLMKEGKV